MPWPMWPTSKTITRTWKSATAAAAFGTTRTRLAAYRRTTSSALRNWIRYPGCEVRLEEVETFDAYRALLRGDIDVLCNWLAVDEPGLTAGTAFAYYERALAVAATHRLARRQAVSIEDLADEEVALLPPSMPPGIYDLLVPPRTPTGHPIRRTQPVQTINEILSLVARGRIVHPTSATVPIFNRDDVVLIPIEDLPPLPLGLVWCVRRENPRVRAFNEVASSMIAAPGTAPAERHSGPTALVNSRAPSPCPFVTACRRIKRYQNVVIQ